jgi:hypothetical protein
MENIKWRENGIFAETGFGAKKIFAASTKLG